MMSFRSVLHLNGEGLVHHSESHALKMNVKYILYVRRTRQLMWVFILSFPWPLSNCISTHLVSDKVANFEMYIEIKTENGEKSNQK